MQVKAADESDYAGAVELLLVLVKQDLLIEVQFMHIQLLFSN